MKIQKWEDVLFKADDALENLIEQLQEDLEEFKREDLREKIITITHMIKGTEMILEILQELQKDVDREYLQSKKRLAEFKPIEGVRKLPETPPRLNFMRDE